MYFDSEYPSADRHSKTIYVYENSCNSKIPVEYKMRNRINVFNDLAAIFKFKKLRLFNQEGLEFFEDDLKFVKNNASFYASNGQQFDPHNYFISYQIIKKLGQNQDGKVFLVSHKHSRKQYAIKIIQTNIAWDIDSIFMQVEILKSLRHQNIVKVLNCLTLKNMQLAIIMQYLEGGQLLEYIHAHGGLTEQTSKIFCRQIVEATMYCHENNLLHRDLTLQNIILENSHDKKIKIVDFGFDTTPDKFANDFADIGYMAPQCFNHDYSFNSQKYQVNDKIDIWAIGIILYGMLCAELPFRGNTTYQLIQNIKKSQYKIPNKVKNKLSKQCLNVIERCLDPNPQTRLTIGELFSHIWFFRLEADQQDLLIHSIQENIQENDVNQENFENHKEKGYFKAIPLLKQLGRKKQKKIDGNINKNKYKYNIIGKLKHRCETARKGKSNCLQVLTSRL